MARPRSSGRKDWPANLTVRQRGDNIYYGWIDPRDGKEKSLKAANNYQLAKQRAKQLNAIVAEQLEDNIIQRISSKRTLFHAWADEYFTIAKSRGIKPNTERSLKSRINSLKERIGNIDLEFIEVSMLSDIFDNYFNDNKGRTAQALRSTLIDVFRTAQQKGRYPSDRQNPAEITRLPTVKIQRARLTLDTFKIILGHANDKYQWQADAFLLSLVTGQGREDIAMAQFKRRADWEKMWEDYHEGRSQIFPYSFIENDIYHATRQKTGALIKIPLDLKLESIGLTVGEVITQCRKGAISKHIIHHTRRTTLGIPGDPVHKDAISRAFTRACNAAQEISGLSWSGKTPPTFHEIRSLAEREYSAQGLDTQTLLGHKQRKTTDRYHDARGAEWLEVKKN